MTGAQQGPPRMLDDDQRKAIAEVARCALDLADRYGIPPTPTVFDLLTGYLDGRVPELAADIEAALSLPPEPRMAELRRLYNLSLGSDPVQRGLEHVHSSLTKEVSGLSSRIQMGIQGSQTMAEGLRGSLRDLAQTVTREQVQAVCKHLVISGRAHLNDTQSIGQHLERSHYLLDELQRELVTLREQANKDHLTGLPNRGFLEERVRSLLGRGSDFCLAMFDLDNFARVNDAWGRGTGDNILRGLAAQLKNNVKGRDLAARHSGTMFAVALPETPLEGARILCDRIRASFAEITWVTQSTAETIGNLTISAGVTVMRPDDHVESIMERAIQMLYRAKSDGRNRVHAEG